MTTGGRLYGIDGKGRAAIVALEAALHTATVDEGDAGVVIAALVNVLLDTLDGAPKDARLHYVETIIVLLGHNYGESVQVHEITPEPQGKPS